MPNVTKFYKAFVTCYHFATVPTGARNFMQRTIEELEYAELPLDEVEAIIKPGAGATLRHVHEGVYQVFWPVFADALNAIRRIEAMRERVRVRMACKESPTSNGVIMWFSIKPSTTTRASV